MSKLQFVNQQWIESGNHKCDRCAHFLFLFKDAHNHWKLNTGQRGIYNQNIHRAKQHHCSIMIQYMKKANDQTTLRTLANIIEHNEIVHHTAAVTESIINATLARTRGVCIDFLTDCKRKAIAKHVTAAVV